MPASSAPRTLPAVHVGRASTESHTEAGDNRRDCVLRACKAWERDLADFSRRNGLLYFRDSKVSTVDLSDAPGAAIDRLLSHKRVRLSDLVVQESDARRTRGLNAHKKRVENYEEYGLSTLHLAIGFATWSVEDGGRPPSAAVFLVPVRSERVAVGRRDLYLDLGEGEPDLNGVLVEYLARYHGVRLEADTIIEDEDALDRDAILERFTRAAAPHAPGFRIERKIVLGNFHFKKLAMINDLKNTDVLVRHDLIAALAGHSQSRETLMVSGRDIALRELDDHSPAEDTSILDADSSQQRAVASAVSGRSGVIQGPPGCGKSQTIANLIAAQIGRGRRVLFVAEKRAALDVVQQRLARAGLGKMVLDLHGGTLTKKAIAAKIGEALAAARSQPPVHHRQVVDDLVQARTALNAHAERLNTRRPLAEASMFQLFGRALELRRGGIETRTRWLSRELTRLDAETMKACRQAIAELAAESAIFRGRVASPWLSVDLERADDLERAMDLVTHGGRAVSRVLTAAATAAMDHGLAVPSDADGVRGLSRLLHRVTAAAERVDPALFARDLDEFRRAVEPAGRGLLGRLWAFLTRADYRAGLRELRSLTRQVARSAADLLVLLDEARGLATEWRRLAKDGGTPRALPTAGVLEATLRDSERYLDGARALVRSPDQSLSSIRQALDAMADERELAQRVHVVRRQERRLGELGLGPLLEELRTGAAEARHWVEVLDLAWTASWIEQLCRDDELGHFVGQAHQRHVDALVATDHEHIRLSAARVRRDHAEGLYRTMDSHATQRDLLRREAEKKSRHLPIRKLAETAPDVLTALFPCWMASPLAVSQYLPAERALFDMVVFDEASQILPEDAVATLLRGKAAVVAGDRYQLPPTRFFAGRDDDDEQADEDSNTDGFESLLDVMSSFLPTWTLDWHYRSKDERLIAFSNDFVYGNRLVTVPSTGGASALRHVEVRWSPEQAGSREDSSSAEAIRAVELVCEHVREHPEESLGVITMGMPHMKRVEALLETRREQDAVLDAYWRRQETAGERLFVKNLERVQGDERDAIILSIGYGKDSVGKLPLNFGPILGDHGYRRLNVAVTRARARLTLLSSFGPNDLDPARCTGKRGLEFLRGFVTFAAEGGRRSPDSGRSSFPVNAFEADIQAELERRGLECEPQWGASSYRIDIAVKHPVARGRFVLAVECDGATYHSAPTARDRDRLRQEHLELLGWRFCRIWSTDWFLRRDQEIDRVMAAYRAAVAAADATPPPDATPVERPAPRAPEPQPEPAAPTASRPTRSPPPPSIPGQAIDDYSTRELNDLARWVLSDGQLRTEDEILEEMMAVLGFKRRGTRIVARLTQVIQHVRGAR